jgi:predicted nucleic acid-binding Zn ribbon protein
VPGEPVPGEPRAVEQGQGEPDRAQRAADALAAAKADARARGEPAPQGHFAAERTARGGPAAPARRQPGAGRPGPPARGRRDDPQPLQAAIDGLLDDQGWRTAAAVGSVFGRWEQIVGEALAAHIRPGGFADGELLVIADSTAWATQVRLLRGQLIRRLNAELGDGTVTGVKVRGPVPPRQGGRWRVRDTRGPRDDYG